MSMNLYELDAALARYEMQFDPETGEWLNEDELTSLEMERDKKIENIALYIKNIAAEAAAIKTEIDNLTARLRSLVTKQKRLLEYLQSALHGEKLNTPRVAVTYRKSKSVEILDENAAPDQFVECKVERKPIKSKIKKYLEGIDGSGQKVEWAKIVEKENMQVK